MARAKRIEIQILPGTAPGDDSTFLEFNPHSDDTPQHALRCVDTDKIYFCRPDPEGGFCARSLPFWRATDNTELLGYIRNIFRYKAPSGTEYALIGTSKRLYGVDIVGDMGLVVNITPLSTTTTTIADSLDSDFTTLGTDPITTVSGVSDYVIVSHTAHGFQAGDQVKITGVSGTIGGIAASRINTTVSRSVQLVIDANSYRLSIGSGTAASSSTSGGGSSVDVAAFYVTVNATAHGMLEGDRAKITLASTFAGIPAAEINKEHEIERVTTDAFLIRITTPPTSSVTAGGGVSTAYQKQVALPAEFTTDDDSDPLVWSMALFGNDVVMTPGNGGKVYIWQNDLDEAPTLLTGAPSAAHWLYVANNAVHIWYNNQVTTSDIGDATKWTPGAGTLAYTDEIEGFGRVVSQAHLSDNRNLIFTHNKAGIFKYVGLPNIYEFEPLSVTDGIIAPLARENVGNSVYWMGGSNWYEFDGASIKPLDGITCHNTVFAPINQTLGALVHIAFVQHNPALNQIIFHMSLSDANGFNGTDSYMIYDYKDRHGTLGRMNRTAGENPYYGAGGYYFMANGSTTFRTGVIYRHALMLGGNGDIGGTSYADSNQSGETQVSFFRTAYGMIGDGDAVMEIQEVIPDVSNFLQEINDPPTYSLITRTKEFPKSTVSSVTNTFSDTTTKIETRISGRARSYEFRVDQSNENTSAEAHFARLIETVQLGGFR